MLQKYRYMDSLDPERSAGVWGYVDIKPPDRKDPRWPRMQVENRCYQSNVFRKLHIELAHRQDGLQVCISSAMLQLVDLGRRGGGGVGRLAAVIPDFISGLHKLGCGNRQVGQDILVVGNPSC